MNVKHIIVILSFFGLGSASGLACSQEIDQAALKSIQIALKYKCGIEILKAERAAQPRSINVKFRYSGFDFLFDGVFVNNKLIAKNQKFMAWPSCEIRLHNNFNDVASSFIASLNEPSIIKSEIADLKEELEYVQNAIDDFQNSRPGGQKMYLKDKLDTMYSIQNFIEGREPYTYVNFLNSGISSLNDRLNLLVSNDLLRLKKYEEEGNIDLLERLSKYNMINCLNLRKRLFGSCIINTCKLKLQVTYKRVTGTTTYNQLFETIDPGSESCMSGAVDIRDAAIIE